MIRFNENKENYEIIIILHSYVNMVVLNVLVFLCGKLIKPCHHAKTAQLVRQQSLASIINKKSQKFN